MKTPMAWVHNNENRANKNDLLFIFFRRFRVNPFRAPEPLPILNPSNSVPKNGFPVVRGLRSPVKFKKHGRRKLLSLS